MGNYNPYLPQILGEEWVPIRDEDLVLNPFANSLERGYSFTLPTATTVNSVRFYLKEWPNNFGSSMIYTASIYPQGQEASSGPVRSVLIPSSTVATSGSSITPINSTGAAQDLWANGDNMFLQWIMGQGVASPVGVSVFFNTSAYSQLLFGKRILGVDLLVGINVVDQGTEVDAIFQAIQMYVANDSFDPINTPDTFRLPDLITNRTPASTIGTVRVHLGDANRFFGIGSGTSAGVNMINQWSYPELARFEASAANRLRMILLEGPGSPAANLGPQVQIEYAAMEVFYCEETRVLAGSRIFNDDVPNRPLRDPLTLGANTINVRTQNTFTGASSLAAGNYTVTLGESNMGDNYYASIYRTTAKLNEVRQLYGIPSVIGTQVNLPFPLNDAAINTTFTSEATDLIPQLTLHATNNSVIDYSHVYGQQSVGQVWGNQTVTQVIDDRMAGGSRTFPWVRFYARRFGTTTTSLKLSSANPTLSGSCMSAEITPAEWDALDEITDGWKEVVLQFTCPPTMGTGLLPVWRWSATGETAGNRWEVLGCTAPAVSGFAYTIFNTPTFNQVPSGQQLYSATYGSPVSGGVVLESWMPQWGPYVSGAANDQASDVAVIFSQAAPAVTGFSLTMGTQAVSGIGLDCGIAPCGIPTHILYNQLSWSYPPNSGYAADSFTRTVVNGLGSADVGGAYTLNQAATNYQVNGSKAVMTSPSGALGTLTIGTLANIGPDFDITITVDANPITGSSARGSAIGRFTDASNFYEGLLQTTTTTGISIVGISRTVGGAGTVIATTNVFTPINNNTRVNLRFMGQGQYFKIKAWSFYADEPENWHLELTDNNLTTGNSAGFAVRTLDSRDSVNIDNLSITPPRFWFDYFEMQRSDEVTDWQTIMKATNPATVSFKDYEARIGLQSNYRIRVVNQYGFPGDWSSTLSIVPPAPGVSGTCLSDAHIMVFSTNERQDGSSNLAYSNAWEGTVIEGFSFPEAGFTQLQPMYDRDFFTAFRPRERGGEQFSRELLVQAAAISPETLADFTSLRDMAWDDVSYICVRDEDGNRWFASVNVPTGTVQNFRKLYMAAVQIVETTDTPSPADPSS